LLTNIVVDINNHVDNVMSRDMISK